MLIVSIIIFQILFFIGLIFMLRKILTQNVASATQHLEDLNRDYVKKEEEAVKVLEEAKRKAQDILGNAQEEADGYKAKTVKEAEVSRDDILKQARHQSEEMIQQADNSRQQLLLELDKRIAKEALVKAAEMINKALPQQFKEMVHKHWVDELIEDNLGHVERLHIPDELSDVKITSAFVLNDDQRKKISKKLKDLFKRDFNLREEIDSNIVAGLVVSVGSFVLDGSLRNKIQENVK